MHYIRGMERAVSASEANRNFSEVLRHVEQGETVAVTRHGRVVAHIVPTDDTKEAERKRRSAAMRKLLDELAKLPPMNLGKVTRDDGYD